MQNKYNSIHFELVINDIKCDTNHSFKYNVHRKHRKTNRQNQHQKTDLESVTGFSI